jgi:hypothetical protein
MPIESHYESQPQLLDCAGRPLGRQDAVHCVELLLRKSFPVNHSPFTKALGLRSDCRSRLTDPKLPSKMGTNSLANHHFTSERM